jgi:hypothetical protein
VLPVGARSALVLCLFFFVVVVVVLALQRRRWEGEPLALITSEASPMRKPWSLAKSRIEEGILDGAWE